MKTRYDVYELAIKTAVGDGFTTGYRVQLSITYFNLCQLSNLTRTGNTKLDIFSNTCEYKNIHEEGWYIFLGASSKRKSSLPIL